MRKLVYVVIVIFLFISCKDEKINNKEIAANYISFGSKITADDYLSKEEMYTKFNSLKKGDTINVKFASTINKVCKKKGCWMRLDLDNDENTVVRFKDYGFFMPLNSESREVIVSGRAYINVVSIEQLQKHAEKKGLSKEEIDKITEEKLNFAIESDGVLMKEESES